MMFVVVAMACGRMGFDPTLRASDGATPGDGAAGDGAAGDGAPGDSRTLDGANALPADAAPGTTVIIADTYLQGVPTATHGSDVDLRAGRSNSGANLLPLLQFDLSALPAPPVTRALLVLDQYAGTGSTAFALDAHRVTQAWTEADASWTSATATTTWAGGTYASTVYATATVTPGVPGTTQWDITAMVNEWLTGTANDGVELVLQSQPPTNTYVQFASRDNATVAWRPQLVVTP